MCEGTPDRRASAAENTRRPVLDQGPGWPMNSKGRVLVFTNGCAECRNDAAQVADFFRANGWHTASSLDEASLLIFQGCAVTDLKAQEAFRTIAWIKDLYPDKELLVWGCLAMIDPEHLRQVYSGPAFGPRQMAQFNRYADAARVEDIPANRLIDHLELKVDPGQASPIEPYAPWGYHRASEPCRAFFVRAATGCLGSCSYCGIRKSRQALSSKPLDDILAELRVGLQTGFDRFILLGTDLGCYGLDRGTNLLELLRGIAHLEGNFKVWVRRVNPKHMLAYLHDLSPEVLARVAVIEIAAQSGSDRVLRAMDRGYTASEFRTLTTHIRSAAPKTVIKSQFIVGFPGEAEEDFQQTLAMLWKASIDFPTVFRYSPRPGSPAADMPGRAPEDVVTRRERRLRRAATLRVALYAIRCMLRRRHRLWRVE